MRRRLIGAVIGLAAMFAAATVERAQAQQAPACPTSPMRLVVLGDSLADGLWASFQRTFVQCDTLEVLRLTAVSDGLAKSSGEEWIARYERDLKRGTNR